MHPVAAARGTAERSVHEFVHRCTDMSGATRANGDASAYRVGVDELADPRRRPAIFQAGEGPVADQ